MLGKKGKIFVLVGMVALLAITGYLNVYINNSANTTIETNAQMNADFFTTYKSDRNAVREQTVMYLDSIINNELSSAESIANAQNEKIRISKQMETEMKLETFIKSVGFEDVAVSNIDENINIILRASTLTDEEVARVLEVVCVQTNADPTSVTIIPVE